VRLWTVRLVYVPESVCFLVEETRTLWTEVEQQQQMMMTMMLMMQCSVPLVQLFDFG
jgi:hypothetical protein